MVRIASAGPGLYFSSVSGKSNDYNGGTERQTREGRIKSMFLCKVAVGLTMNVNQDMPHLTGQEVERLGFDSVTGVMGDEMGLGGGAQLGRQIRLHATL
jgi:hypothetical protein